jgi:hypothetical protein
MSEGPAAPHFDAYNATVYAHPVLILDHLEQALLDAGEATERVDGPPVRYYGANTLLLDQKGHRHLSVRHGGANGHPYVECKGTASTVVAEVLRANFDHSPARIDSAVDRSGPDLFMALHGLAKRYEAKLGLRLDYAGAALDHRTRGSTFYLGSRKSMVFVRIYQKGLQVAEQLGLEVIPDELRNWVRLELEFKPDKKPAKQFARTLSPRDVWGTSQWTHEFAIEALSMEAERVNVRERRESNHERALRFMAKQYRTHLDQLLRDCNGDYEAAMAVLVELAELVPRQEAA